MPRVKWGVGAEDVDDFDRDSQFKPYAGPIPPNGVYAWKIKVFKYVAGAKGKNPQMRPGLELVPRAGFNEGKYAGYFVMDFIPVADNTTFRYVPLLDALGVSGREFETATLIDEDGNIKKIGKWRNNGDTVVIAQLRDRRNETGDNDGKEVASYGEFPEDIELADEDDVDLPDDDDLSEDVIDEDYEEEKPARRKPVRGTRTARKPTVRKRIASKKTGRVTSRRRPKDDDDYVDEDGF